MGLSLGLGLLAGARAVSANMAVVLLLVVASCVLLALTAPGTLRAGCLCLAFGCASGWAVADLRASDSKNLDWEVGSILTGTVTSDPQSTARGASVLVEWTDANRDRQEVFTFVPADVDLGRGDLIYAYGELSRDGGSALYFASAATIIQRADQLELARRSVRKHVSMNMVEHVPGSSGSLVLGLLVGDDSGLTTVERDDLRRSGLSHITAVSGWNVSVVVVTVGAVFRAFGARTWPWLGVQLLLLSGYVWIVGLEPPIQRAAIMGSIALVALQLGRPAHLLTLLMITAGAMAAWSPEVLNSLSYMLSFLAMLGLVVAARLTEGLSGWRSAVATPAIVAGLAGIATAPLIAASFGTLSLMTVPANIVVAPLVPVTTFAGMFVVATSWISPLAAPGGWISWTISSAILWVSRVCAGVPGTHVSFSPLQPSTVFTMYFGLALMAAPCLPEGRALLRRMDSWYREAPAAAFLLAIVVLGILAVGVLVV